MSAAHFKIDPKVVQRFAYGNRWPIELLPQKRGRRRNAMLQFTRVAVVAEAGPGGALAELRVDLLFKGKVVATLSTAGTSLLPVALGGSVTIDMRDMSGAIPVKIT